MSRKAITPLERVTVKLGRTINLGDFESYRIDIEYEAIINEGEEPQAIMLRAMAECRAALNTQHKRIKKQLDAREQ